MKDFFNSLLEELSDGRARVDAGEPRWPASGPLAIREWRLSCDGRKFDSLAIDFLLGKDFLAFSEP